MIFLLEVAFTGVIHWCSATSWAVTESPGQCHSHVCHLGRVSWKAGSAGPLFSPMSSYSTPTPSVLQGSQTFYMVAQGSKSQCSKMPLCEMQDSLASEVLIRSLTFFWSSRSLKPDQTQGEEIRLCLSEVPETLWQSLVYLRR